MVITVAGALHNTSEWKKQHYSQGLQHITFIEMHSMIKVAYSDWQDSHILHRRFKKYTAQTQELQTPLDCWLGPDPQDNSSKPLLYQERKAVHKDQMRLGVAGKMYMVKCERALASVPELDIQFYKAKS